VYALYEFFRTCSERFQQRFHVQSFARTLNKSIERILLRSSAKFHNIDNINIQRSRYLNLCQCSWNAAVIIVKKILSNSLLKRK